MQYHSSTSGYCIGTTFHYTNYNNSGSSSSSSSSSSLLLLLLLLLLFSIFFPNLFVANIIYNPTYVYTYSTYIT